MAVKMDDSLGGAPMQVVKCLIIGKLMLFHGLFLRSTDRCSFSDLLKVL